VGTISAFTRVFDALWRKSAALSTLRKKDHRCAIVLAAYDRSAVGGVGH
jgi:hypothetical protein